MSLFGTVTIVVGAGHCAFAKPIEHTTVKVSPSISYRLRAMMMYQYNGLYKCTGPVGMTLCVGGQGIKENFL